ASTDQEGCDQLSSERAPSEARHNRSSIAITGLWLIRRSPREGRFPGAARERGDHEVGVPLQLAFSLIIAIEYSVNDASFVGLGREEAQDADDASSLRDGISLSR
ncbi:hypothetical protein ALC56_03336, partial [Trachymyrmex septentrionalis]